MNEENDDEEIEVPPELGELIARIESAFSSVRYPGDDNLISTPEHRADCDECADLYDHLRGLRWEAAAADDVHDPWISHGMSFFLPKAWQYYLPAYLIRTIRRGQLGWLYFFPKSKPVTAGLQERRIALLSKDQCSVVVEYLEAGLARAAGSPVRSARQATALEYWKIVLASKPDP